MAKNERVKENVARRIWLEYFNNYLFEAGLIDRQKRDKMTTLIQSDRSYGKIQK